MINDDELYPVGKLQKTHALKGELNVLLDISPDYFESGNPAILEIDGIYVPFYLESLRPKGSFSYLVKFEGIDSEFEAKQLVNKTVFALRDKLKEFMSDVDDDDYLLLDEFVGWTIKDKEAGEVGTIMEIDTNTENQLFIVMTPEGKTVYIPFTEDFIEEMDQDNRVILMSLPEGLIGLNV